MGTTTLVCAASHFLDKSQLKNPVFAYDGRYRATRHFQTCSAYRAAHCPHPVLMVIEWRESFCTGIPGVDHEHRRLVSSLNEVMRKLDDGFARQEIINALDEIYADIASHFSLEEEMMRRSSYHETDAHAADHHRLLDEIRDLTHRFERPDPVDTPEFEARLTDWFGVHFSTFDARLHRETLLEAETTRDTGAITGYLKQARDALLGRNR